MFSPTLYGLASWLLLLGPVGGAMALQGTNQLRHERAAQAEDQPRCFALRVFIQLGGDGT